MFSGRFWCGDRCSHRFSVLGRSRIARPSPLRWSLPPFALRSSAFRKICKNAPVRRSRARDTRFREHGGPRQGLGPLAARVVRGARARRTVERRKSTMSMSMSMCVNRRGTGLPILANGRAGPSPLPWAVASSRAERGWKLRPSCARRSCARPLRGHAYLRGS